MVYFLRYFDHFKRLASRFRWFWDAEFISSGDTTCCENKGCEDTGIESIFALKNRLPAGWYMLEVKIDSPTLRSILQTQLDDCRNENDFKHFPLPVYSGRMSKRIIHLATGGMLRFNLQSAQGRIELQHFRVVRVTQKFARSRLLRKLQALHPSYKVRRGINWRIENVASRTNLNNLPALWLNYCALFEDNVEIVSYPVWIREFDTLTDERRVAMRSYAVEFENKPLIAVVMPVYNPNPLWLKAAIESVRNQLYSNWELCIADDASSDPAIRSLLECYAHMDPRIKVVFREQNGHISAASNSALALVQGEWVALLDHDDLLSEDALFWVVDAINHHHDVRLIYSDEDKIDEAGARADPYFKCDWNADLFYSQNLISHLGVYQAALVREVGGFRTGVEGSQDYDLALRCIERLVPEQIHHIPRVLYHWRIHAESTAHDIESKPYAVVAGEKALNEHFMRIGVSANAESVGYGYRVRYTLPNVLPLVSLIIATRNGLKFLKQCVESILNKTTYCNYEILVVDNGSDDRATLRYLKELASNPRILVIRDERPFNYSALNNEAVKFARGEIVGLINNDIEVISPEWLSEMVSHALRVEVGVVGARLWYGDNTIQHAGIILGMEGFAGHGHRYLARGDVGYCGRASLIQSFSAVTGACLLVRKAIYQELGGLNEKELQVACNDVDFCLRVREAGYRNIWTPYAELYHHESATRGFDDTPEKVARAAQEVAYMHQRWGKLLQNDPAYSPNLSFDNEGFTLAWPCRVESIF